MEWLAKTTVIVAFYSKTSMTRIPMARLPWIILSRF